MAVKCKSTNRQLQIYSTAVPEESQEIEPCLSWKIGATNFSRLLRTPHRNGYIICKAQCKVKIWDLLFRNYYDFQDGDNRGLIQVLDLSEHRALGNCPSHMPMKLDLIPGVIEKWHLRFKHIIWPMGREYECRGQPCFPTSCSPGDNHPIRWG